MSAADLQVNGFPTLNMRRSCCAEDFYDILNVLCRFAFDLPRGNTLRVPRIPSRLWWKIPLRSQSAMAMFTRHLWTPTPKRPSPRSRPLLRLRRARQTQHGAQRFARNLLLQCRTSQRTPSRSASLISRRQARMASLRHSARS